jgi:phenylacetate-CoA ligase
VVAYRTGVSRLIWQAITVRDHLWHRRDFRGKLMSIRHGVRNEEQPDSTAYAYDWGPSTRELFRTGPGLALDVTTGIREQIRILCEQKPDYLLAYPSNIAALGESIETQGTHVPPLKEMRTYGEILPPGLRELCRRIWNVKVVDNYSSQEIGYMALQCPRHEHYHIQSETVLLEVLDDAGEPCECGEVGRIAVTPLHNFAMPLIRYEIGDYAEVGEPCDCRRGLPVLKRILGRERNMLILPNGDKIWPSLSEGAQLEAVMTKLPPIEQFQIVQTTPEDVQVRLVAHGRLTKSQEQLLSAYLSGSMGYAFHFTYRYVQEIPRSPTGKFEECICLVGAT